MPLLLTSQEGHIGSTDVNDVDLALDHDPLQEPRYESIKRLLEGAGYWPDPERRFAFYGDVALGDGGEPDPVTLGVDLVAAEYGVAGRSRQSQPVHEDVRARKVRRADLVFDRGLVEEAPMEGPSPAAPCTAPRSVWRERSPPS